jgi:hypothetical protein
VILDRWRDTSTYRSHRLSRLVIQTSLSDQGTTILTKYMPGGNHVHNRNDIVGDGHFPSVRGNFEIWVPWKVVPVCLCVSKHKGGDYCSCTLLYDSNFTLTLLSPNIGSLPLNWGILY